MSDYAYVADRAKRAFASVARLENELVKRPGDRSLSINLTSMRRLAQQAQIEMERLAEMNQIELKTPSERQKAPTPKRRGE